MIEMDFFPFPSGFTALDWKRALPPLRKSASPRLERRSSLRFMYSIYVLLVEETPASVSTITRLGGSGWMEQGFSPIA